MEWRDTMRDLRALPPRRGLVFIAFNVLSREPKSWESVRYSLTLAAIKDTATRADVLQMPLRDPFPHPNQQ